METARHAWVELDGYAVAHGMGYLQDLDVARFSHFVWFMITRNAEKEDMDKLRAELWRPEVGTVVSDPRSPWSAENEKQALAALKTSLGA